MEGGELAKNVDKVIDSLIVPLAKVCSFDRLLLVKTVLVNFHFLNRQDRSRFRTIHRRCVRLRTVRRKTVRLLGLYVFRDGS